MIATSQMGAHDNCEPADGAVSGNIAHLDQASGTQVATTLEAVVASTHRRHTARRQPSGKSHLHEIDTFFDRLLLVSSCAVVLTLRCFDLGRIDVLKQQVTEMCLIQGNTKLSVCFLTDVLTHFELGS